MRKYAIPMLGATAAMLAGGMAAPAAAAPDGASVQSAPASTMAGPPACIGAKQDKHLHYTDVSVTSHCNKYAHRIKVLMAHGKDSRCFSVQPGQTRHHRSYGPHPRVDRMVLC